MRKCALAAVPLLLAGTSSSLLAGVNTTFSPGDVLVSELGSTSIQQYNSSGTLLRTYTGTGSLFEGASLTPTGQLVTTYRTPNPGGVDGFSPTGTQTLTFTTPQTASQPADLSVFPDGVIAVNNQTPGSGAVEEYSPTGTFIRSITLSTAGQTAGSCIAPNGTLWVVEANGPIENLQENGTLITTIKPNYSGLVDLVVDPTDNSLYVTDYINNEVHHYSATGTELGEFSTNLSSTESIGIAPDDSLFVDGGDSNFVDHYTRTGTLLGSFPLTNPNTPVFMSVVPAPIPEPATLSCGALLIAALSRRSFHIQKRMNHR